MWYCSFVFFPIKVNIDFSLILCCNIWKTNKTILDRKLSFLYSDKKQEKLNNFNLHFKIGLVWFLCLMAYQLVWIIECQSHPCRTTAVILFNPYWLWGVIEVFSQKVNAMERLKFELAFYDVAVQNFSHYSYWDSPPPLK